MTKVDVLNYYLIVRYPAYGILTEYIFLIIRPLCKICLKCASFSFLFRLGYLISESSKNHRAQFFNVMQLCKNILVSDYADTFPILQYVYIRNEFES